MPQALILSGAGRYADPWHPFADTSARLAGLAADSGWEATITEDIDAALATGLDGIDLLIVNAGDSWRPVEEGAPVVPGDPAIVEPARAGLAVALARGMTVLGMHISASSLRDYPQYREVLGGEWVPGRSWHPPLGEVHVRPLHDEIVEGCCDFTVVDERYTDLVIDRSVEPLAGSEGDDVVLAWANQVGPTRAIYDALGHDLRSYDSKGHRSFLRRALTWLLPRT